MIDSREKRDSRNSERGVALVAVMVTLLLVSAITAGMIIVANTETNISANFRDEQRAFFSAKGGIEEARDRMRTAAANSLRTAGTLPTTLPGGANSVLYVLNPANGEAVAPWGANYPDTEICNETTAISCSNGLPTGSGWYSTVSASPAYAAAPALDWKWVRITLKQNNTIAPYFTNGSSTNAMQVCWNGTNEYADPLPNCSTTNLPVYLLTALAVTPSGSRRIIQTELVEDKVSFFAPSALTLDGTGDLFSGGNSSGWNINGMDQAGCGSATTGNPVHAIGVPDSSPDVAGVSAGAIRTSNYTGSGGTTPDVANVSSSLPSNLQSVSSLQALMSTVMNDATQPVLDCSRACSGLSNPGTVSSPQIIYVNGDLKVSGSITGYGVLAVTGTLNIPGTLTWNGLILVIGDGRLVTSGTSQFNGAVLVAQTVGALGTPLSALGPAKMFVNGGGNGGIQYSSSCIALATSPSTFHVVAIRELMN